MTGLIDRTGVRYGHLVAVEKVGNMPNGGAIWRCLCDCGNETRTQAHTLAAGNSKSCGKGVHHPRGRSVGDAATCGTVHSRLRDWIGRACERDCVDCGRQARDWSYRGGDPNERIADNGQRFSLDLSFYDPRCRPCHVRLDKTGFLRPGAR